MGESVLQGRYVLCRSLKKAYCLNKNVIRCQVPDRLAGSLVVIVVCSFLQACTVLCVASATGGVSGQRNRGSG